VLALQGAFEAHRAAFARLSVSARLVRTARDLDDLSALVLPGGESGVLLRISRENGLFQAIRDFAERGGALLGTCAGAILLARRVRSPEQESLGLVDIDVARNAYGRQVDSFEATSDPGPTGEHRLVFIRAPRIERLGPGVEVLARHRGEPTAVREGRVWATTFHPELSGSDRFHAAFCEEAVRAGLVTR
jgi:5'-phosphate synthase pdxT subunit